VRLVLLEDEEVRGHVAPHCPLAIGITHRALLPHTLYAELSYVEGHSSDLMVTDSLHQVSGPPQRVAGLEARGPAASSAACGL
jgi:hypothetical protein